ncbi:succinylglutamate desuccinylase/aspartoacylase family protein [Dasania marina]|uniref:succinylglutamate desuccinylase/aspartoacylase domain-containing protein n=1 Tax=Dasania marina TaxID=471499 RepID=UPI0030DAE3E3|tara:strand:+ start:61068 stop:62705 length:1638 start_codon:yes stop_codon:yes gene_type:complete
MLKKPLKKSFFVITVSMVTLATTGLLQAESPVVSTQQTSAEDSAQSPTIDSTLPAPRPKKPKQAAKPVDLAQPITIEEIVPPPVKEDEASAKVAPRKKQKAIVVAKPAKLEEVVEEPSITAKPEPTALPTTTPAPPVVLIKKPQASSAPKLVQQTSPQSAGNASDAAAEQQQEKAAAMLPAIELSLNIAKKQQDDGYEPLVILDTEIPLATATRLAWTPDQSFKGIAVPTPVLVVHGAKPGPVVCLTAAIHGDELNGIEIVRRVLYNLKPEKLTGTVIGVPIVNLQGFHRNSRYLADRRDLNRYFPGNPAGSSASRLAHSFFNEVIAHCDALVDLHTGSFYRTNLPQLRANTKNPEVLALAKQFGATVIVHGKGAPGTLRWAAVKAGIPAVTLEAGESMRLQVAAVEHGVKGIETLLEQKNMLHSLKFWKTTEAIYKQTLWVRADQGGILFSRVSEGAQVKPGDILGVVTDPITNVSSEIIAPFKGRVIGMALNQVVMPGFATFHLGIEAANMIQPQEIDEYNGVDSELSSETVDETITELEDFN